MLSFRRWLDRKRDRRQVIRISRGSTRKRRWWQSRTSWMIAVLLALLFVWSMSENQPISDAKIVRISRLDNGMVLIDGVAMSTLAFERRLAGLGRQREQIAVVLPAPDPQIEAMLGRYRIGWLSPGVDKGGDHGR